MKGLLVTADSCIERLSLPYRIAGPSSVSGHQLSLIVPKWHHVMGPLSVPLAHCVGVHRWIPPHTVIWNLDVFYEMSLNKLLKSKSSCRWLWRHCNDPIWHHRFPFDDLILGSNSESSSSTLLYVILIQIHVYPYNCPVKNTRFCCGCGVS